MIRLDQPVRERKSSTCFQGIRARLWNLKACLAIGQDRRDAGPDKATRQLIVSSAEEVGWRWITRIPKGSNSGFRLASRLNGLNRFLSAAGVANFL